MTYTFKVSKSYIKRLSIKSDVSEKPRSLMQNIVFYTSSELSESFNLESEDSGKSGTKFFTLNPILVKRD